MENAKLKQEYLSLARGIHTSLTPVTDVRRMKELRGILGISNKPRNMDGWAARTVSEQKARNARKVL